MAEGRVGLNLKVAGEAAQKRRVAAFFGGLTDEEVEVRIYQTLKKSLVKSLGNKFHSLNLV